MLGLHGDSFGTHDLPGKIARVVGGKLGAL